MKFVQFLTAVLIFTAGMATGSAPATAQATTATSSLSGLVIDISSSGEAQFLDTSPEPHDDWGYLQEDFIIQLEVGEIHISFVQGDVTTESWFLESHTHLASLFDRYAVLDERVSTDNGWALSREQYWLEYELLTYSEFYFHDVDDVNLAVSVHTTEANIVNYIEWTRENVLVGGDPVALLAEVDYLGTLVDGSAEALSEVKPGSNSSVADWREQGLLSETTWVSPRHGSSISWDSALWEFPFHRDGAITIDDSSPFDAITLITPDSRGLTYIYIGQNIPGYLPGDWVMWLGSEDFLTAFSEDTSWEPVLIDQDVTANTGSAIFLLVDSFGFTSALIIDVYLNENGTIVMSYIFAAPENLAAVYEAYWDGVLANDDYYPLTWELGDIETLTFP